MPDGKKRPRKRSRKNKTSSNPQQESETPVDVDDQSSTELDHKSSSTITESPRRAEPPSNPIASSSSSSSNFQQTSLSKSYPRLQNTNVTFNRPVQQPQGPQKSTNTAPKPQAAPSGPTVSFHERTNAHKPSVIPNFDAEDSSKRNYTLSIALPGSIVRNAQTPELQSRLAGHIGRTCAIFNVDEIVVFDDGEGEQDYNQEQVEDDGMGGGEGRDQNQNGRNGQSNFDPGAFLARVLQYLETPQYLRKALFPMHRDLRLAGLLPPLDCPHHLRFQDQSPYREGVTVETPPWSNGNGGGGKRKHGQGNASSSVWVNIGLKDPIEADVRGVETVPLGTRVTVKMPDYGYKGRLVSPREPVESRGIYWGYSVRLCPSLSQVLVDSPWKSSTSEEEEDSNYDLIIGTSERGTSLTEIISSTSQSLSQDSKSKKKQSPTSSVDPLPKFKHALVVFGGLSGLEIAVEKDQGIQLSADDAHELFDSWINVVEGQGSRTIRTEEALMITLARLKSTLEVLGQ